MRRVIKLLTGFYLSQTIIKVGDLCLQMQLLAPTCDVMFISAAVIHDRKKFDWLSFTNVPPSERTHTHTHFSFNFDSSIYVTEPGPSRSPDHTEDYYLTTI